MRFCLLCPDLPAVVLCVHVGMRACASACCALTSLILSCVCVVQLESDPEFKVPALYRDEINENAKQNR